MIIIVIIIILAYRKKKIYREFLICSIRFGNGG
jgi:hypothetical protein